MQEKSSFERARSPQAKRMREQAILDAAVRLSTERGVRAVTLTDIAADVGLHKSAMLRYFETREEIFLRLAAAGWQAWSAAVRAELDDLGEDAPLPERAHRVAAILAGSLASRPLFCDLLAHTPLNLERNVSLATVRAFKVSALAEANAIATSLRRALPLDDAEARDVVATATGMAGALWQMAAPGTQLRNLYETDPQLSHAVVEVGPRLTAILARLLSGSLMS
ncbi:TetR/AcrR family transcriptional regulator [Aeromicrobium chenweiae]|nr:TetR family transcriptional regulator [Aeromicrobium chenweiae]